MSFLKQFLQTTFTQIIVILVSFVTTIIVARELGSVKQGEFSVIQNIIGMAVQFGQLGLSSSIVYFFAKANDNEKSAIFWNCNIIGITTTILITSILIILEYIGTSAFGNIDSMIIIVGSLHILPTIMLTFLNSFWLAINKVRLMNILFLFKVIPNLFYSMIVLYVFDFGILEYLVGLLFLFLIQVYVQIYFIKKYTQIAIISKLDFSLIKQIFVYGIYIYIVTTLGWILIKSDLLLVNYLLGSQQAGYYSISVKFAELTLLFSTQLGILLFPRISSNPDDRFITARISSIAFVLMVVVSTGIGLGAFLFIPMVFGIEYQPSVLPLIFLLPGMIFLSIDAIYANYLSGIGQPEKLIPVWFLSDLTAIIINCWLLPEIGIIAASISSTIGYFMVFCITLWMVSKKTNVAIIHYFLPLRKDIELIKQIILQGKFY